MKKIYLALVAMCFIAIASAQTPVPMATQPGLTYIENFADIANWTNGFASGIGANRFAAVPVSATGTIPSGTRITTTSATFFTGTTGGVQRGSAQSTPTQSIVLLSTGGTDNTSSVAFDFLMDFSGVNAGTLSFDWATVFNSTGDRNGSLRVYYSTDGSTFTELSSAQVLNFTNNVVASGSKTDLALPSTFNNSPTARLRFYYHNATGGTTPTGSRPKISIDNLKVTATATAPGNTVSVASGTNASESGATGSFTINFSAPTSGSTSIDFAFTPSSDYGTEYNVSFSAGIPTSGSSGTLTIPNNTSTITVTITAINDAVVESTKTINLTLSSPPSGYTIGNSTSSISLLDDDVAPTVSVSAGANAAEPSTNGTFILNLSAPAPTGGVTVTYSLGGTASTPSDYTDPQSGSITIAQGNSTGTVTLNIADDAISEPTENIILTLTGASNGYTASGSATINVTDDDVAPAILLSTTYSQDFNSLSSTGTGNTWTDNATIPGWYSTRIVYNAGNGSSNAGALYSFGTTGDGDRSLGTVGSGSTNTIFYGARFKNNTGTTITSLKITYRGEQWRNGGSGSANTVNFGYQTGVTVNSLTTGFWNVVPSLDFSSVVTGTTAAAVDGNVNFVSKNFTITGLNIPANQEIMIRWEDIDHSGSDDGLGIDGFFIEANPNDVTPPVISSLTPADDATNVALGATATINFDEAIQKGTSGTVLVKKLSDNSVVQTIDITTSDVTVSGTNASFALSALAYSSSYYIEVSAGAFKDFFNNNFAGISGNSAWNFSTEAPPAAGVIGTTYDFNACSSSLTDGFVQFSVSGTITWGCTTFGRDPAAPSGTAPAPYGVQINGFSGGSNVTNVDWFISPSFDLTATTYPLLSFWSRTAFNGLPLQLKVSTDYTGGNPAAATWVDVNGKFPGLASNIWTLSNNINLSAFKQSNVHFAFVYTSSDDEGARWTLDDIRIDNSSTPPPPSLTVGTTDMQFPFVAAGSSSDKTFSFTGNDITTDVTITVTGSVFTISKDGTSFGTSITYTQAEANNTAKTVTVRFSPSQPEQNYTGTVNVSTSGLSAAVNLKGTSVDPANTLEVVNWNIEWFGSPDLGPPNNTLQEQNVKTVLQNVGADIYGLLEVVDESRLANIVSQMPGYSYVISNYGSHTNTSANPPSALAAAQKMAFVYRTSVFSNITTTALLSQGINSAADLTNPAYNYFASGRFPFMMSANVTLNGITKNVKFVLIHAKANTSPTDVSYTRRKKGSDTLNYTLNLNYPNDNIVFFGDLNDDLDVSITAGQTVTSYVAFTNDNSHFYAPTLALSQAGKKSTVSYNDVIDHVILSNEMQNYYIPSSANILTDVASTITNYGSTTTDHYPVFTRYSFAPANIPLPVKLITFNAVKDNSKVKLTWSTSSEVNAKEFAVEKSTDGRNFQLLGTVHAAGNSGSTVNYSFNDAQPNSGNNYYRLRVIDQNNHFELSKILRIDFSRPYTFSVSPNPARSVIVVTLTNASQGLLEIVDMNGKVLKSQTVTTLDNKVDVSNLSKGMYLVRLKGPQAIYSEKLVIE